MASHLCNGAPTEEDDGFYLALCTCGWRQDGLPDLETAIDFLMEHAAEAANA